MHESIPGLDALYSRADFLWQELKKDRNNEQYATELEEIFFKIKDLRRNNGR